MPFSVTISRILPDRVYVPRVIRQMPLSELIAMHNLLLNDHKRSDAQQRQLEYTAIEMLARQEGVHKEPCNRAGHVYVLKSGEYYKIGRSRNVEKRARALQTASPFPVDIVAAVATSDAVSVERELHRRYAHAHVGGEWFALSDAEVADLLEEGAGLCQSAS